MPSFSPTSPTLTPPLCPRALALTLSRCSALPRQREAQNPSLAARPKCGSYSCHLPACPHPLPNSTCRFQGQA